MLFNSYEFILVFLPAVLWAYYQLGKTAIPQLSIALLIGASLFFYAWWNPAYLTLLVASMLINYAFGIALSRKPKRLYLTLGVTINLVALGYYKYSNFFIDNLNVIANTNFHLEQVILPLAISFFTFQQIAFLVDAYKNEAHEYQFLDYCLFVSFFPQLIAGPIVHHKEMMPQFQSFPAKNINYENLSTGLAIFIIGLAKKVLIADNLAPYANETFAAAGNGVSLSFLEAWKGAFAYTFQLYFDFSGYSDMAIGLALMFGIRLPINFNSPYKATNIIEFWRCWHMTLSRFLRDYIYFPLGGNRHGQIRRYTNLLITMLLGGLWHGAAWTFVFWGFLHGIFLAVNHAWHAIQRKIIFKNNNKSLLGPNLSRAITFVAIVIAWVFFRADSFETAINMLTGMAGLNGIVLPEVWASNLGKISNLLITIGIQFGEVTYFKGLRDITIIAILLFVVWSFPNSSEIVSRKDIKKRKAVKFLYWKPSLIWAIFCSISLWLIILKLSAVSDFLYFQF